MPRSVGPLYRLQKQRVCYVCDIVSNLMNARKIVHVTWLHSYTNYFCADVSRADAVFVMHRLTSNFIAEAVCTPLPVLEPKVTRRVLLPLA